MKDLSIEIKPQMPETGICFVADAPVLSIGQTFSIKASSVSCYHIVESSVAGFTAVVYGMFCRILKKTVHKLYRAVKLRPYKCKRSLLVYAGGGLRL